MTTGKDIAARRQALDMTQDLLAGAAGVSRSTVQRAERGLPVSAESMRSIRAVLGLPSAGRAPGSSGPPTSFPAATNPEPPAADVRWAWYADPCLLLPALVLAALPALVPYPVWAAVSIAGQGLEEGSKLFILVMATLAAGLPAIALSGRLLWRRFRAPRAGVVVLGLGLPKGPPRRWAGGTVEVRSIPIPLIRWSVDGRMARTWPGAALSLALVPAMVLAMHAKPLSGTVAPIYARVGYSTVRDLVPAWRIEPGSPLERAGLRLGDLVTSIDGKPVRDNLDLWSSSWDARPGPVDVVVLRAAPKGGSAVPFAEGLGIHLPVRRMGGNDMSREGADWMGDLRGLMSTSSRDRSLSEILRAFGKELSWIAAMTASPGKSRYAIREGNDGHLGEWMRWLAFRSAAEAAVRTLVAALALAVFMAGFPRIGHGLSARGWSLFGRVGRSAPFHRARSLLPRTHPSAVLA